MVPFVKVSVLSCQLSKSIKKQNSDFLLIKTCFFFRADMIRKKLGTYLGLISWQNINPKSNVKTLIFERRKPHPIVLHIWLSRCLVPSGVKENNSIGVGIMHSFSFLHDVLRWLYLCIQAATSVWKRVERLKLI